MRTTCRPHNAPPEASTNPEAATNIDPPTLQCALSQGHLVCHGAIQGPVQRSGGVAGVHLPRVPQATGRPGAVQRSMQLVPARLGLRGGMGLLGGVHAAGACAAACLRGRDAVEGCLQGPRQVA